MFNDTNFRQFQKGLDTEKFRNNRHNSSLSLRRKQREEHLQKKRRHFANNSNEKNNPNVDVPKMEDLDKYINQINNEQELSVSIVAIRKLLSIKTDPPISQVCNSGIMVKIIHILTNSSDNQLQLESAWIITNICSATAEFTKKCVKHGAIQGLMGVLSATKDEEIVGQCLWALTNITGDVRNRVLQTSIFNIILSSYAKWNIKTQRNAIWLLSNLLKYKNDDRSKLIPIGKIIIPFISDILSSSKDIEIIKDSFWTLSQLASMDDDDILASMVDNKIVNKSIYFLKKESTKFEIFKYEQSNRKLRKKDVNGPAQVVTKNCYRSALEIINVSLCEPILRVIGNIMASPNDYIQCAVDNGFVDVMEPFLSHFNHQIRKESMWTLSNVLAGTYKQIEFVLSNEKILKLIITAANNDQYAIKKEALWGISNATSDAVSSQLKKLTEYDAIEPLCRALNNKELISTESNLIMILEGLTQFLEVYKYASFNPIANQIEEYHGLEYLDNIISSDLISQDVHNKINEIQKDYFDIEEEILETNIEQEEKQNHDNINADINTKTNQFIFAYNNNTKNSNNNNSNNNNTSYVF